MITLTEQELIELFDAGRNQGSDETTSYGWGSRPDQTSKRAFIEALQQIIYDRRRAESTSQGLETWPTGAQWPDEDEVRDILGWERT